MVDPVAVCSTAFNGFVCKDITTAELCGWAIVFGAFGMAVFIAAAIFDWLDSYSTVRPPRVVYVPPRNRKTLMGD